MDSPTVGTLISKAMNESVFAKITFPLRKHLFTARLSESEPACQYKLAAPLFLVLLHIMLKTDVRLQGHLVSRHSLQAELVVELVVHTDPSLQMESAFYARVI